MEHSQFKFFIDLITFDQSMISIYKKIQETEQEIANLQKQVTHSLEQYNHQEEKVAAFKKEVDAKECEMKMLDQEVKKRQTKLDNVANNQEYQLLKHEITTLKKEQHEYEDTLLQSWSLYEAALLNFKTIKLKFKEEQKELEGYLSIKNKIIDDCKKKIDQNQIERKQKVKDVPEKWLEKYDRMRHSVSDPVVPINKTNCSACFYGLPHQDILNIQDNQLVQCKQCYRLLYQKID